MASTIISAHGSQPLVNLPKHIHKLASANAGNGSALPAHLANALLLPGKPCKARCPHSQAWSQQAIAAASRAGGVTGAGLVALGIPAHNVAYQVKSGWLVIAGHA